jgi:hypothetical protein
MCGKIEEKKKQEETYLINKGTFIITLLNKLFI